MNTLIQDDEIKNILGVHYLGVTQFFKYKINELAKEYKYVVLLTRRCLMLYEILNADNAYCDNIVSSLHLLDIKEHDKILIVDDIIIHGRTVNKLYTEYTQLGAQVSVLAYCKCVSAEYTVENLQVMCMVTTSEWRNLSDMLVKLIVQSRITYAAFTPTFVCNSAINFDTSFEAIDISCDSMLQQNITATGWFLKNSNLQLLSALHTVACLREYNMTDSCAVVYASTVFVDIVTNTFCVAFAKDPVVSQYLGDLCQVFSDDYVKIEYKGALFSLILNYLFGRYMLFINKCTILDEDTCIQSVCDRIIARTFTTNVLSVLKKLSKDAIFALLNVNIMSYSEMCNVGYESVNKELNTVNARIVQPMQLLNSYQYEYVSDDIRSVVFACFSALHAKNEERISTQNIGVRHYGYTLKHLREYITDIVNEHESLNNTLIASLITLCDVGYAAYTFKNINGVAVAIMSDGEQVYKINYIRVAAVQKIIYKLYQYIKYFTFFDIKTAFKYFYEHYVKTMEIGVDVRSLLNNYLLDLACDTAIGFDYYNSNQDLNSIVGIVDIKVCEFIHDIQHDRVNCSSLG